MIQRITCYEDEDWQALLDADADDFHAVEMTKHLESCSSCRSRLESVAANKAWWSETSFVLATASTLNDIDDVTHASAARYQNESLARYLKPSDTKDSLGASVCTKCNKSWERVAWALSSRRSTQACIAP